MKIVCVGKIKESYYSDAIKEYQKRLSKYTNLEIIEVADINYQDIKKSIEQEQNQILKNIKDKDYVITLEIEGHSITSEQLSKKIDEVLSSGNNLVFIIGGSNGLGKEIKRRANYVLSFSKLTFPHQLFRVILLEQIYRSYKILNNEKYHK